MPSPTCATTTASSTATSTTSSTKSSSTASSATASPGSLYRVGHSELVGRHMVAARDILPGEIIFTDSPACIGPDSSSKPCCLGCHRPVDGRHLCRGCGWPMCFGCEDKEYHREECALFRRKGTKIKIPWFDKPCFFYDAILPIRVLLLKTTRPKIYKQIAMLMDHNDMLDEAQQKHRDRLTTFIRETCKLGDEFGAAEVHHVLGVLSVNAFVVRDSGSDEGRDLIGLYALTSLMSHHCIANTVISVHEDFGYTCRAAIFIPEGAEIVTSYHHYHYQMHGTQYRRKDLHNTWSFLCTCLRCSDPSEKGTFVSAVRCQKCKHGHLLPREPLNLHSVWGCDACETEESNASIESRVDRFEDEIDALVADEADIEHFEKLLRRAHLVLHPNHYWILDIKRKLIDIYGHRQGLETDKLLKGALDRKAEYCDHLLSIASVLCPGPSEMRGYLLFEAHGVRARLLQWRWMRMRITSQQYRDKLALLESDLEEAVSILAPMRSDSDEGKMGIEARQELEAIKALRRHVEQRLLIKADIKTSTKMWTKTDSADTMSLLGINRNKKLLNRRSSLWA